MGSQHSSPSKAGSQAPLLRHPLHKFASGVSGVSSHDNPMFDALSEPNGGDLGGAGDGSGSTQQSVLPQRAGSWDLHSQLVTQHAFNQAVAAAAAAEQQGALDEEGRAAAARAAANAAAEAEGWRPDILAMMQQKAATGMGPAAQRVGVRVLLLLYRLKEHTVWSLLVNLNRPSGPRARPAAPTLTGDPGQRRQRQRRATAADDAGSSGSSSSGEESGEEDGAASSGSGPADWQQLRRSKSWDGHLQESATLDSLPLVSRGAPSKGWSHSCGSGCSERANV